MAKVENHRQLAVALSYEPGRMRAPVVSAKGEREAASELRRLARRFGVPILTDKNLIASLSALSTSEEIPLELYDEVAGILAKFPRRSRQ